MVLLNNKAMLKSYISIISKNDERRLYLKTIPKLYSYIFLKMFADNHLPGFLLNINFNLKIRN